MDNNNFSEENQNEDFNLRDTLERYLYNWQWFILTVCISLVIAFVYLRYTTPQFQASTKILVKDERKAGMLSELSAFSDMGIGTPKNNIDNEIEILKSRTLVENTVKQLGLNVSMIIKGNVIENEVYGECPIDVVFSNIKPEFYKDNLRFEFLELTPNTFELTDGLVDNKETKYINNKKEFKFGELISTPNGDLVINKSIFKSSAKNENNNSISIIVNPIKNVVSSYQGKLQVDALNKTSNVVVLTIVDPIGKRAEAFLDNLIKNYNEASEADKSSISENTSKFVANRLLLIAQELDGVEKDVERFKTSNKLTDIATEASLFIEGSSDYNKKRVEIEIQLNMVSSMLDFIKKSTNADLMPTNIITGQGDASDLMNSYNDLVLERNRILKSATMANPAVVKLDAQISALKYNISESLRRLQSNLNIQQRDLKNQEGILDSKIEEIPVQERQFRVIARQQKVKEELYLYLLQKREETAISLAATAPNARVIDAAKASEAPISPRKDIIYLSAMLFGFLVPFGFLYLTNLLDTKVKSRFDIMNKVEIPYLGDVPKADDNTQMINSTSRTGTAEALRIVKTNLDFMLSQVPDNQGKIIYLTSTIPGEGKTFLSVNLASTMALSGIKVLLMGMDVRNPKLNEYIDLPSNSGLTDYLASNKAIINDYIFKSKDFENLYVLPAGVIPPNPTELLMSKKVGEILTQFKNEYDYIIVDMAPVSLVSDTLMLAKYADATVYAVRANFLDKRMLHIPKILYKEGRLSNMAVLLNDTLLNKSYGYGYGYGYGTSEKKVPWYKKIFNS